MKLTEAEQKALLGRVGGSLLLNERSVPVQPAQLRELLRVYAIATSQHMRECLLFGETVGPGDMLDALFPERRS